MVTLSESIYFYLAPLLGLESDLDKESVGYHGKEIIEFAEYIATNNFNLRWKIIIIKFSVCNWNYS